MIWERRKHSRYCLLKPSLPRVSDKFVTDVGHSNRMLQKHGIILEISARRQGNVQILKI